MAKNGLLKGRVDSISPDTQPSESQSEALHYRVTILPQTRQLQSESRTCRLQAGMRGRADIATQNETILQTLLRKLRLATR